MITAVVTTNGRMVIPAKIRQRLNIKKGIKLYIAEKEGQIVLQPLTGDYFEKMAGVLNTKGKLTKALLEERTRGDKKH